MISTSTKRAVYSWPIVLIVASVMSVPSIGAQDRPVTAFVDVSVVPMDRERVLTHQTVLVRGDSILAVGPTASVHVPDNSVRIDGRGKFLIPGLTDMHVHIGNMKDVDHPAPRTVMDSTTNQMLFWLVANGVTTVRDMGSDVAHLELKERVARGEQLGPRIYTAVHAKRCRSGNRQHGQDIATCVANLKKAGYNFLKLAALEELFAWNAPQEFDSIIAASTRIGLPVVGHVMPSPRGLSWAFNVPYASFEHLYGYTGYYSGFVTPDHLTEAEIEQLSSGVGRILGPRYKLSDLDTAKLREAAATTKRLGIWNTPTLIAWGDSGQESPSRQALRSRQVVRALRDAGAKFLVGTDIGRFSNALASVHQELEALVAAGLTPYQALEAGTKNAAIFLGTLGRAGTIQPGKQADLVLLNGDPLSDVRHVVDPAGVMVRGRWLAQPELHAGLAASCWPCRKDSR